MGKVGKRLAFTASIFVVALSAAACGDFVYFVSEARWSDVDTSVVALRTVFPPGSARDYRSLRMEVVRMPADDLGDEEVLKTFSLEKPVNGVFFMESRGYIAANGWSGDRRAGLIIDADDPSEVTTVVTPDDSLILKVFVPSPDGALIAAVSLYDGTDARVDVWSVDAGEFVASWSGLRAFSGEKPGGGGARWSPSGDLYVPQTSSPWNDWWRFDGGLADPVVVEPPPCVSIDVTTSGVINSDGVGLCHDYFVETCERDNGQGEPLKPYDCGSW